MANEFKGYICMLVGDPIRLWSAYWRHPRSLNLADVFSHPHIDDFEDYVTINLVSLGLPSKTTGQGIVRRWSVSKIINAFESEDCTDLEYKRCAEGSYFIYRYVSDINEEGAQFIIPTTKIPRILEKYHDNAFAWQYGADGTFQRIALRFYWSGILRTIVANLP